ncbi:FAD/FMN-containing dehydrogenase [Silvibacterium bohemicum]|uniref:FAD/FMN-containing dehydrogenase n=1 Tax=Silvibacterium bohemicum TaxID=1577686 RepID=A0A841JL44_9BACT|nr:FAD-binding oxidoreductase [Silvibacterium bohemicum]MBB6142072.1 FAD/FMN-containing dehydrogenase [Silvibacterium bohemicum]
MKELLSRSIPGLIADPLRFVTAPAVVERLSKDFYWYSPVLKKQLEDKHAEAVVQPVNVEEIRNILRFCYKHDVPVTPRGAGTGNYGQAIPLHGGLVLDLSRMDRIETITEEGVAICEPGVRLGALETEARTRGRELRCYPSTIVKASLGGFLGGGSGGIGSVAHGGLRDFETVRAVEVVTMENEPQVHLHEGAAVHDILHAWGTNGIITKIWLALTPKVEWAQCAAAFDEFASAYNFSEGIAVGSEWTKRVVTTFEWPIPSYFSPIKSVAPQGKHLIFFMIAEAQLAMLEQAARSAGGTVTHSGAYSGLRTTPLLSDYTWNHTTLWAIKHDDAYTYLQCGFDPDRVREQMKLLKEKFGDEILFHIEFMKNGAGRVIPGAIPLVSYTTEERLNEMIGTCREIGVFVANPHVNNVEDGGRFREDHVQLAAKRRYDPKGLLNPGKMLSFQSETEVVRT